MAQVSDEEIAREVRTLRNLRRRSVTGTGPGALPLDPDLPPPSPGPSVPTYSSNDDITLSTPDGLDGDAAGVFWVPAHLHPELAPGEFRAFLKSHTHADPENTDGVPAGETAGLGRSPSWLSRNGSLRGGEGLGRKRSMLSRQYQPKMGDGVEEEEVPPLPSRQRMSMYRGKSSEKGLTLSDLQKMEEVMDEAGEGEDPEQVRTLLRRSLSMNVAPGFLQDDVPQDENGEPVPPPRPGSILRRSARTKIRKSGLPGEGGAHRFASTRKGRMTAAPVIDIPGLEDDDDGQRAAAKYRTYSPEGEEYLRSSSSSHDKEDDDTYDRFVDAPQGLYEPRPDTTRRTSDSSTDETHIFDAYARDSRSSSMSTDSSISENESPSPSASPPGGFRLELPPIPRSTSDSDWFKDTDKTPTQETSLDPLQTVRKPSAADGLGTTLRPAAAHLPGSLNLSVPMESRTSGPTSPSAQTARPNATYDLLPGMAPPAQRATPTIVAPTPQSTEHEAIPPSPSQQAPIKEPYTQPAPPSQPTTPTTPTTPTAPKEKEKEKKGGFFSKKDKDKKGKKEKDGFLGSLFGGHKKKQEETMSSVANFSSAGPAAAAALLGSSKSAKSLGHSPGPSPTSPGFASFARYPIHVERAVYRLSHIKLANARRPLYEQVLISNLMFWYLGIIGRNVAEDKTDDEKKETKPPPAKGTPPKPVDSGVAGRPLPREQLESIVTSSPKKTSLTKPERSRTPGREAEAPVRAPSYGLQSAQVDSEIRSANMGLKGPRPLSQPSHQPGPPPSVSQQHPPPLQQQQQPSHIQHPPQPPRSQPPPQYPPGGQPPYPHMQQQQQQLQNRGNSLPPINVNVQRALSPPSGGSPSRATSDHGHGGAPSPTGPRDPRAMLPPSFSGPAGPRALSHSQSLQDLRGPDQRYQGGPPHPQQAAYPSHAPLGGAPPQNQNAMRRVTPEPRSPTYDQRDANRSSPTRTVPPQHAGPQVGQIFHHPSATPSFRPPQGRASPAPGQVYNPQQQQQQQPLQQTSSYGQQPGQVFRPPQQPGQQMRPSSAPPGQWEASQRLPPGASHGSQGNYPFRPPPQQQQVKQPPPQGRGYPAHAPQLGHPYPPSQRPMGAPGQGVPGQHAQHSVSHPGAQVYRQVPPPGSHPNGPVAQRSGAGLQPGQVMHHPQGPNGQGMPQRQHSGDGYRPQPVQGYHR